jgi:GST-like protein
MYELHAWPTPNGYKVSILLEELGQPHEVVPVDIGAGDQFRPDFLEISPNNKMPVLVDRDGPGGKPLAIFESGAIMMYLAEKHGRFWPADTCARYDVAQWLMFQMASVGPMLGQAGHFLNYAPEPIRYAIDRYVNEGRRIYGVLDRRLAREEWLAGGAYSIADMAVFPWLRFPDRQGQDMAQFPNLRRWFEAIDARPATKRGCALLAERRRAGPPDAKAREMLFGATQYQKR